jgi:perosamine synthetase
VDVPGLSLPPRPLSGLHAWHLYAVRVRPTYGPTRDELISVLREEGIGSSVHFVPLHNLSWFRERCLQPPGGFPGADAVFAETLSLPFDQAISDSDVDRVCDVLARSGGVR